eukprot:1341592-Rhodomonas_salina.1
MPNLTNLSTSNLLLDSAYRKVSCGSSDAPCTALAPLVGSGSSCSLRRTRISVATSVKVCKWLPMMNARTLCGE